MMTLIAGSSDHLLAKKVSEILRIPLIQAELLRFHDGELYPDIPSPVQGKEVVIFQTTSPPVNAHMMELFLLLDALKRGGASKIVACIPYLGYGRQDRKTTSQGPISAKLIAKLLSTAGATEVFCVDAHSYALEGFFDIPFASLDLSSLFGRDIEARYTQKDLCIVAPDRGAASRASAVAAHLNVPWVMVDKERKCHEVQAMRIFGCVSGKHCFIIDDILGSGGTLAKASHALFQAGARSIYAYVSHGLFLEGCLEILSSSPLRGISITDSVPIPELSLRHSFPVHVLSLDTLLATHLSEYIKE